MEKESEHFDPAGVYIDKPKPGKRFLQFLHAALGGSLLLTAVVVVAKGEYDAEAVIALVLSVAVVGVVYWMSLGAAYGTYYRLKPDGLELRCGIISRFIAYHRILEIGRVHSYWALLKHGIRQQSFCNRFGNFVQLKLKGEFVFLSPSEPDRFIAMLRERIPEFSHGEHDETN